MAEIPSGKGFHFFPRGNFSHDKLRAIALRRTHVKVAAHIVSNHSLVVTEKLNLKGMTRKAKKGSKRKRQKSGLNRNLLDVAIAMLRESFLCLWMCHFIRIDNLIKFLGVNITQG